MTMFIRISSVCNALETALQGLSHNAGDAVRALLAITTKESRSLCLVPVREGCLTELWAHYIYASDREETTTSASDAARISEPSGWIVLPGPEAAASQVRRLAEIVEAFHFFAPLGNLDELTHVDGQLAQTIATIQRIRPTPTEELFGDAIALFPPATFAVRARGVISIEATIPPRPQNCPRYRANSALLPDSLFVLLHAPDTRVEVDPRFGLFRLK